MSRLARRIWKWTAAFVAGIIILLAIGVGLFRLVVPMVPALKTDAELMAEQAIGWPVEIEHMDLRWALLGPELVLHDVQLLAPDTRQPLVTAKQIDIAFGPADLFQEGARPSHLRLHEPRLALERTPDGRLVLSGYALPMAGDARLDWRELLEVGLQHGRLTIVDGELHYRDRARDIQDWTLQLPRISLASNGREHEFEGSLVPPGAVGEQLAFRFSAIGPPGQPEAWDWKSSLGLRGLRLGWWYQQFPWAGPGELDGGLDLAAELEGHGADRFYGNGRLAVSGLAFASREPAMVPPAASVAADMGSLAMEWQLERDGKATTIDVQEMLIERDGQRHGDISLSLRAAEGNFPLELAASRLPLGEVAAYSFLLPSANESVRELKDIVRRLQPRGYFPELVLSVDTRVNPLRFRVDATFEDLGVDPWKSIPGIEGVSGYIHGDNETGRLILDSRRVEVDAGELFRGPLPAERVAGQLQWAATEEGWRITGERLRVENPEASADAAFTLDLPKDGPAVIDARATAHDADFRARSRWLPVGVMSDALVKWLDNGVLDGHAPEATMVLKGPLENYPFRDGSGVFDIRFRAEDAVVEYAPGWPKVENLSADVHFHGPSLDIRVDHAEVMDELVVEQATASIADFRDKRLVISADAGGGTDMAWSFLSASPLSGSLNGLLENLSPEGPFSATLDLDIPMDDMNRMDLRLDADLAGIDVQMRALPWPVQKLRGRLLVTEDSVRSEKLSGLFTGSPVTAAIDSGKSGGRGKFGEVTVTARGHSPAAAFDAFVPASWLARLEGDFDWTSEIHIPGDGQPLAVDIESSLEGLESQLPAPLDRRYPVNATVTLVDDSHIDTALRFADLGAARLRFVNETAGWRFDRGQLDLGSEQIPELSEMSGLTLTGNVLSLAADEWLSLNDETGDGDAQDTQLVRTFDLAARNMSFHRIKLVNQSIKGRRAGAGWELELAGPVSGAVGIPSLTETGQPWQVMLQTMHLPLPEESTGDGEDDAALDPRELPGIVLDVRDAQFGPVHLGHVRGELERTNVGYTTRQLSARAPTFDLSLDGRWEFVQDQHYTSIVAKLATSDLGDTLAALGYRGGIEADEGHIDANIAWHGSPLVPDRARMEGNIGFEFLDGALREVRPGAGRLLGLLSIAALPRRLLLDFSDFFGEGLHFDSISGDFLLTGGSAYTTNVQLRGPSVSALLVGRTGLVDEDYDQLAIIDPDVSASLPVAGYLAAGPSVGAALLLLSQLLKAPLTDIAQVRYRITGSWENPDIQRLDQKNDARSTSN